MTKAQQEWIDLHGVTKCPPSKCVEFDWRAICDTGQMQPLSQLPTFDDPAKQHPWRGQWENTREKRKSPNNGR